MPARSEELLVLLPLPILGADHAALAFAAGVDLYGWLKEVLCTINCGADQGLGVFGQDESYEEKSSLLSSLIYTRG